MIQNLVWKYVLFAGFSSIIKLPSTVLPNNDLLNYFTPGEINKLHTYFFGDYLGPTIRCSREIRPVVID
jgi:hypothetical protein